MRLRILCLPVVLVCLLLWGCQGALSVSPSPIVQPVYERFSLNFFDTFDTLTTIIGYAPSQGVFEQVSNQAHQRFQKLHQEYDIYNAYEGMNNIFVVNRDAAKAPVKISADLMALLRFCQEKQPITRDKTDISLGAMLSVWHDYREAGLNDPQNAQLPPMEALEAAATHTGMANMVLDEAAGTVFFRDPQLQLDIGAVAKGFAVELVAQEMLASHMPSFIISAGGNVRVGQPPLDGKRKTWAVGIQDPDASAFSDAPSLETFFISNLSMVTSGDYQRYYVVNGQRYHHLIDPVTLMPSFYCRAVTILTEDSGMADLLSTAAFLMPYEESRAFIENLPGVEALWVLPDGTLQMTEGALVLSKTGGASPSLIP